MSSSSVSVEESYLQILGLGDCAEGLVLVENVLKWRELLSWIGE